MRVEDLIAELQKHPALRRCVKDALGAYGSPERRISCETSDRYIARAFQKVLLEHGDAMPSGESALRNLLAPAINMLVFADERTIRQKIETTDWPVLTKKLLALTIRRHGYRIARFGTGADDYVQEAITLFLDRRRHYPVERPELTLLKFLVRIVDSLVDHAYTKVDHEGEPLRLVSHTDVPGSDEWLEERLAFQGPDPERQLIAAESASCFLTWLGDDIPLQKYARLRVYDFCATAADCAYALNTTVSDVRNRERRFRRRLRQFRMLPPQ